LSQEAESSLEKYWADYFLFKIYDQAGLYQEASEWLQKALEDFPNGEDAIQLAWLLLFENTGSKAQALHAYEQAQGKTLSAGSKLLEQLVRQKLFYRGFSLQKEGLDENVSFLAPDHDDLWVSTWDGGLARYSTATGLWRVWLKPGIEVSPIKYIVVTRWFVYIFRDRVLSRLSKLTETWRDFQLPPDWSGLRVQAVVALSENELLIANLGQGLWKWEEGQWTDLSRFLPSKFINALTPAQNGGWWVGTQDQGGGYLDQDFNLFRAWKEGPKNVTFILARDEDLYVGSFGEGLWIGPAEALRRVKESPAYVVCGLLVPESGVFWGGSFDHGAFSLSKGIVRDYSPDQGFASTDVTSITTVGGALWWGSTDHGLGAWYDDTP
jgi:tetratricopeptide (TPR) repeat protein